VVAKRSIEFMSCYLFNESKNDCWRVICMTTSLLWILLCFNAGQSAYGQEPPQLPSPLTGNWLLSGSPPTYGVGWWLLQEGVKFDENEIALAVSLNATGTELVGGYTLMFRCGSSYLRETGTLTGSIVPSGSFTIQTPLANGESKASSLVIQGKAPSLPGSIWDGTYTYRISPNSGCHGTYSNNFQASPIMLRPGEYRGQTTLLLSDDPKVCCTTGSSPIDVTFTLESVGNQPAETGVQNLEIHNEISTRMKVSGYPCYQPVHQAVTFQLFGSSFLGEVPMIDGSTIILFGWFPKADGQSLILGWSTAKSGSCIQRTSTSVTLARTD